MDTTTSPTLELGRIIRTLRKNAGITGGQLGERVSLSQSKISKLEHGIPPLPEPNVITNILEVLDTPKQERREIKLLLLKMGASASSEHNYNFIYQHGRYWELERNSVTIQNVLQNIIPALLQTAAYREAVLTTHGLEDTALRSAMRETSLRQDNLWNKSTSFEFLIHEAALYTMPAGKQVQLAQLDKLERFIGLPNLEIGIIPADAGSLTFDQCNFVMYDKRIILRSVGTLELENTDSETILQYVQMFEELSLKARFGPDAARLIADASTHITELPD